MGGFCILKLEFFVEAIFYSLQHSIPSVIIEIRNNMDNLSSTSKIVFTNPRDRYDAFKKIFMNESKSHQTSFLISLDQYRLSGIKIGDRISIDITIDKSGEISN